MPLFGASRSGGGSGNQNHLVDAFFQFLASSVWQTPIVSFVEQCSIVFERAESDPALQQQVHEDYKRLVDTLVECFCDDAKTTPRLLRDALAEYVNKTRLTDVQNALIEPLYAASNYDYFVPMMMRKNVELQLEALQMIEYVCGFIPAALELTDDEALYMQEACRIADDESERLLLVAVIRQSRESYHEESRRRAQQDSDDLQQALVLSSHHRQELEKRLQSEEAKMQAALAKRVAAPVQGVTDSIVAALETPAAEGASKTEALPKAETQKRPATAATKSVRPRSKSRGRTSAGSEEKVEGAQKPGTSSSSSRRASTSIVPSSKSGKPSSTSDLKLGPVVRKNTSSSGKAGSSDGPEFGPRRKQLSDVHALLRQKTSNPDEVAARAAYLKEQRDKLVAMKRAERERRLEADLARPDAEARPKTAQAARGALAEVDEKQQQKREVVAGRLRRELAETLVVHGD